MQKVNYAQRSEGLLLALEQVVVDYLHECGGEAKRLDIVNDLGLRQPTYPAINSRRLIDKSWVAQTILARLEQRGVIVQHKPAGRTIVRFA